MTTSFYAKTIQDYIVCTGDNEWISAYFYIMQSLMYVLYFLI